MRSWLSLPLVPGHWGQDAAPPTHREVLPAQGAPELWEDLECGVQEPEAGHQDSRDRPWSCQPSRINAASYFTCLGLGFPSRSLWGSRVSRPLDSQLSKSTRGAQKPEGWGPRPSRRLPRAAPAPPSPSPCAHRAAPQGARFRLGWRRLDGGGRGSGGGRGHGSRQLRPRP